VDPTVIWLLIGIAIVVIAGAAWFAWSKRRSTMLRERFGPEYDHTVRQEGDVKKAEAALAARAKRVEKLQIKPLSHEDADRFGLEWRRIQALFVDDPNRAVSEADRLVGEVMTTRGYPVGDFEQRVADISVDHPEAVMNYRAAREMALQHQRGEANTEDLRQAMVHYRALFNELLETDEAEASEETRQREERTPARSRR